MRLTDLEPKFLKREAPNRWACENVGMAESDGIMFLCPLCIVTHGGKVGCHSVICWRPRVPQDTRPTPGRWDYSPNSTGLHDLTLVAGSSSVLLQGGCQAHFFIIGGGIQMAMGGTAAPPVG